MAAGGQVNNDDGAIAAAESEEEGATTTTSTDIRFSHVQLYVDDVRPVREYKELEDGISAFHRDHRFPPPAPPSSSASSSDGDGMRSPPCVGSKMPYVAQLQAGEAVVPEGVDANNFDFLAKGGIPCVFFFSSFLAKLRGKVVVRRVKRIVRRLLLHEIDPSASPAALPLKRMEREQSFDDAPLYFLLHESIYADGPSAGSTNWAAHSSYEGHASIDPDFDYRVTSMIDDEMDH